MNYFSNLFLFISALFSFSFIHSQVPGENALNPYAVGTYECGGIYWKTSKAGPCRVRYKEAKAVRWTDGYDLVYDSRDGEYRGSIIKLNPDTEYQVELSTNQQNHN